MIDRQHVWAVTLRYLKVLMRDRNAQVATVFWPFLNIVIWGYFSTWMSTTGSNNLQLVLLSALVLWELVNRTSFMLSVTLLEELWSGNLMTFFATPLYLGEWVAGALLFTGILVAGIMCYCCLLVKLLYGIPLAFLGHIILLFGPPLALASISVGFFALSLILFRGKRASELVFLLIWILAPISGVFYPQEVLPLWVQKIGAYLPLSYIFSGLRGYVLHAQDPSWPIAMSYVLGIIYCCLSLLLFFQGFKRAHIDGLARLMD
jgi:ABC-2 type transport system permease protein